MDVRVVQRVVNTSISLTRFQTATATADNTPGLHNNRISSQTIRNRLRENGFHAQRHYVGCVLTQCHCQHRINWARVHTLETETLEYRSFFRTNQDLFTKKKKKQNKTLPPCFAVQSTKYHEPGDNLKFIISTFLRYHFTDGKFL